MSSSERGGLAAAVGIIGIAGCAAFGTLGVPSGGGCAAKGGKVDARSVFIRGVQAYFRPFHIQLTG
jgi:hypothetical protein